MKFVAKSLILLLSIATGFGADKDQQVFRPVDPEDYPNRQTISKLTIAADAFTTRDETEKAFGKLDPKKYGILPVLVLFKNDSSEALRLDTMKVEYMRPDRRRLQPIPAHEVRFLRGVEKPNPSSVGMPAPPIPGIGRKKKNPLAADEVEGRSFAAKMLPPNDSAWGFFYFNTTHWDESLLYVTGIVEAATGQELFFYEIPLE